MNERRDCMGERIEFPNNEQFYMQEAIGALEQQHMEDAIDILEKGFLQTKSPELLAKLTELLQKNEEWLELLWLFDENHLSSREEPNLYYHSLLQTQQIERLESELQRVDMEQFPEKEKFELQLRLQKLAKQQQELEQLSVLQTLLKHPEKGLSREESYYYSQWLVQSSLVEKELFFEKILLDSRFSLLDKAIIIDSWVIEGQLSSLRMLRGTEIVVLDKDNLTPLSSHEWLQNPLAEILPQLEESQLEMAEVLAEKLKQDVIRLYPFDQDSIGSLKEWVSYFSTDSNVMMSFYDTDEQLLANYQLYQTWRNETY